MRRICHMCLRLRTKHIRVIILDSVHSSRLEWRQAIFGPGGNWLAQPRAFFFVASRNGTLAVNKSDVNKLASSLSTMTKLILVALLVAIAAQHAACAVSWLDYFSKDLLKPERYEKVVRNVPLDLKRPNVLGSFKQVRHSKNKLHMDCYVALYFAAR